jgi:hypothetical protein
MNNHSERSWCVYTLYPADRSHVGFPSKGNNLGHVQVRQQIEGVRPVYCMDVSCDVRRTQARTLP